MIHAENPRSADQMIRGGPYALTKHLGLAMQRQMPGKLRNGDMGSEGRGHHAPVHHTRRHGRLHDDAFAGLAGIARPERPFHPDNRRHDVERLAEDWNSRPASSENASRTFNRRNCLPSPVPVFEKLSAT